MAMSPSSHHHLRGVLALISLLIVLTFDLQSLRALDARANRMTVLRFYNPKLSPTKLNSFDQMVAALKQVAESSQESLSSIIRKEGGQLVNFRELLELSDFQHLRCSEAQFRVLLNWRKQVPENSPLASYIRMVIKKQRSFCEQYLGNQTALAVESFTPVARDYFDLFLAHDQIGQDFYVNPDASIEKLRQLQSHLAPHNPEFAPEFLSACNEVTSKFAPLVTIRGDHEIFARLSMSCDIYFRAQEFCHHLVKFDYSEELAKSLLLDVGSRLELARLVHYLDSEGSPTLTKKDEQDPPEVVAHAALGWVREKSTRHSTSTKTHHSKLNTDQVYQHLGQLKEACASARDLTDNLLWLRNVQQKEGQHFELETQLTPRARGHLRSLDACKQVQNLTTSQLVALETEELAECHKDESMMKRLFRQFFHRNKGIV